MEPINEDQQLGALIESVENLQTAVSRLTVKQDELTTLVMGKLKTVEVLIRVFKFLGLALIALLTFQLGDIARLWSHFFR